MAYGLLTEWWWFFQAILAKCSGFVPGKEENKNRRAGGEEGRGGEGRGERGEGEGRGGGGKGRGRRAGGGGERGEGRGRRAGGRGGGEGKGRNGRQGSQAARKREENLLTEWIKGRRGRGKRKLKGCTQSKKTLFLCWSAIL